MDPFKERKDAQKLKDKVVKYAALENVTQTARIFLRDDDPRYWQEAFPILVSTEFGSTRMALVCSAFETFDGLETELRDTLKIPANKSITPIVYWISTELVSAHNVDEKNLYATLRMMQARPGKDLLVAEIGDAKKT